MVGEDGITAGAEVESDDSLRSRLLTRIRETPHGGAYHDYLAWALEVPGVTRAWCYPQYLGLGTVGLAFVCDDQADILPDAEKIAEMRDYIEARRPVTAVVTVFAPIPVPLDLSIRITPNLATVAASVETELRDLIYREAEPGGTIYLSHIREAISLAVGEVDHELVSPIEDVVLENGEITVMGAITWL
jgi:uncharacterized phage protein gp47/JayE